jgi:hypothetical protein
MKKLWVTDGVLSLRVYFCSDAHNVRLSAGEALTNKLDDELVEWSFDPPVEVLRADQIDSFDRENDEAVYLVEGDETPNSLRGWIIKLDELAEQAKQEKLEAEAAARQLKLFGDDGT